MKITLSNHEFTQIVLCGFRYALGRHTGIAEEFAEYIYEYWDNIQIWAQKQIVKDIRESIHIDKDMNSEDVLAWSRVLRLQMKDE